jgi:uncharacterized protein (DUF1015 family)
VQTLPSGHGSGLVLAPFRGVRYDPSRVSGLGDVTSPPYDVIGPGTLDELLAASPYNVVRLILPGHSGLSLDARAAGAEAARRLRSWLASGVLAVDGDPALYVYEQRGPGFVQRGLIGLVAVGTAGVLPHEGVMPGPVTGRRELMMATQANLEPIFLVYNGGAGGSDSSGVGGHGGPADPVAGASGTAGAAGGADLAQGLTPEQSSQTPGHASETSRLVDLAADRRPPLFSTITGDGITHRIWPLTDPAEHAAIAADLAGRTALIADGHHRYAAYRELRALMRGDGRRAGPWDYGLAFLVDGDAYPPRLGAIHRVIPHLAPAEAERLAGEAFTVEEVPGLAGGPGLAGAAADGLPDGWPADPEPALRRLAEAGGQGTAFLLAGRSGLRLLTQPDRRQLETAMPPGASARWRTLDAAVLQELLLARLWSIKDNERDVLISHDAGEAVRMAVDAGGTAVVCNPMPFAAVKEVAAHGECVPRKSTSFGPKPRTGLVLRTFEP